MQIIDDPIRIRHGRKRGDNNYKESRNLRALPLRPSEDQLSNGKAWEDWLDGIERQSLILKLQMH